MKFSHIIKELSTEEKNSLLNYFLSEKEESIAEKLTTKVQTLMSAEELRNPIDSDEDKLNITEKEKEMIQLALERHDGDLKKAAADLGLRVIDLKRKKIKYSL